ncbi:MAG: hypothetical protein QOD87_1231 [Pseudonocardiales bacterium]|jgi:hypothetical protein|nr:hypothetical protein [Pseudonocardiales bacterium]
MGNARHAAAVLCNLVTRPVRHAARRQTQAGQACLYPARPLPVRRADPAAGSCVRPLFEAGSGLAGEVTRPILGRVAQLCARYGHRLRPSARVVTKTGLPLTAC